MIKNQSSKSQKINEAPVVISHQQQASLEANVEELRKQIVQRGDLPHASKEEQLNIVKDLATFPLGQFLINNRGLNGYWTDYILMHPQTGRLTQLNCEGKSFSELEDYILNRAPVVLATQERFNIFHQELQKRLDEGIVLASIPCGLMSDLLTLDFSSIHDYTLFGVDLDENAITELQSKVQNRNIEGKIELLTADAWQFHLPQKVDVITSNGLNIYETNDTRVVELYRQFYGNLKYGGCLITSFLTEPPGMASELEWVMSEINPNDARLQKILFADILNISWQAYRSTKLTIEQLEKAGFTQVQIISDRAGMFPTVVAQKL
jgi:hypothetical protein